VTNLPSEDHPRRPVIDAAKLSPLSWVRERPEREARGTQQAAGPPAETPYL